MEARIIERMMDLVIGFADSGLLSHQLRARFRVMHRCVGQLFQKGAVRLVGGGG